MVKGAEGEGPKSWGAALVVARRTLAARTTEASCIVPRIFQDSGQPANYVVTQNANIQGLSSLDNLSVRFFQAD